MLIKGWHLNKKLKMTLPTHPERKTFGLISFLVPVISRETLPLKDVCLMPLLGGRGAWKAA